MISIDALRNNPDLFKAAAKNKTRTVDIDKILFLDKKLSTIQRSSQILREKRNAIAQTGRSNPEQAREEGKRIKEELRILEQESALIEPELTALLLEIPNIPLPEVPVGHSEEENRVTKEWGVKPHFGFTPRTHWQIAQMHDLIDKERATKVAGSRFAYIKGDLVLLQMAIVQYVMRTLGSRDYIASLIQKNNLKLASTPFTPILPPAMIRTEPYEAMDRLDPREERYQVGTTEDNLWLQGSAEHTLGSMYWNETLPESMLPVRYLGYLTSFRREAGTYGKDTEGIMRMHQFDKLEMEVFSTPETGIDEHKLLIAIQEQLMQDLAIPYRMIQKCTFDIGKPNASGWDVEAWMPGQDKYRETHTADYMTDYQSRRLNTRVKRTDGTMAHVHTNDATAFALGRIMIAIMENYQQADGSILVPEKLQSYCGLREVKSRS